MQYEKKYIYIYMHQETSTYSTIEQSITRTYQGHASRTRVHIKRDDKKTRKQKCHERENEKKNDDHEQKQVQQQQGD